MLKGCLPVGTGTALLHYGEQFWSSVGVHSVPWLQAQGTIKRYSSRGFSSLNVSRRG